MTEAEDPLRELARERILGTVARHPDTGCWLWRGQISNSGYGRVMIRKETGNKIESAHFASYEAFVAPLPQGSLVRQTCGNRLCVNPDHLEVFQEQSPG